MADYLKGIYTDMGRHLDPDVTYFILDSRFLALEKILRSLPRGRILDAGCGRGLLLRRLGDHHECFGCDFDQGAVDSCKGAGLDVRQADLNTAEDLGDLERGGFDAIVISEVCEHLLNPRSALRLLRQYLAPKGKLILTIPNAVPLLARLPVLSGRRLDWLHYPSSDTEITGHIRFYTIDSMSELLSSEGFSIEAVLGVSFRLNGRFWERACYWLPRLTGNRTPDAPAKVDGWLGQKFPSLAPGLLFLCAL